MDHDAQWQARPVVEFIDDTEESPEPPQPATHRAFPIAWALSGAMCVGAALTIVSVFRNQVTFRVGAVRPGNPTYGLDGLGHLHVVGQPSSLSSIDGHAPALGAVGIGAAVLLIATALAALLPQRRAARSALTAGVACLAAGGVAAAFACDVFQGDNIEDHTWAAGVWLFAAGAIVSVVAALAALISHQRVPN